MEFGRKRLQELGDHKRKKLQEKLARKLANSEDTSPVHQILNSSADILQTVIAVGRRHTQTYEMSEENECSKLNREGGITLLGNISPTLGVKPRSPVPGLTSKRRSASPRSRCIANGLKHRVAIGNENRGNKTDVKDPMELVPLCSAPHHNDRLNEGDEGYSNKLFQRRESGGTLETPLSEPDEVLIVSSDTRTDPSSCSIKVISPDCEEVKDSKDQSMSHGDTDYNRNLRQNSKCNNIVRSNSYYGDRTPRHNGGKQKDRAEKWARERKGRSLEIAEAKGECTRQKMDYLAVDSDEVPNLSRCHSLPMSIDNSLGTNAFAGRSQPATGTPAQMSIPVDAEDITNDLGEILIGFKGIIERKLRQCGDFYEARIAELEAINARREEQIQQLTQSLNNLQSSLPPQPSRLPSVQDPARTTRL